MDLAPLQHPVDRILQSLQTTGFELRLVFANDRWECSALVGSSTYCVCCGDSLWGALDELLQHVRNRPPYHPTRYHYTVETPFDAEALL